MRGLNGEWVMVLFRLLAWILVALGIALLGADAVTSLETGEMHIRTTEEILGHSGLDLGTLVEAAPESVNAALSTVLRLPFWAIVGVLGLIFTLIFRPLD